MAIYKIVDAEKLDNDLRSVADKLREKSGTTGEIEFPLGFENTIDNITTSGGENKLAQFFSKTITELTEEDFGTATHIPFNGCFQYCSSLISVTISNKITYIPSSTFYSCSNLKSVVLPNSLTRILTSAFRNCSKLENINIPNECQEIDSSAFNGCSLLKEISIPANTTIINGNVFGNCRSIESIKVDENNTKYHSYENCIIETETKKLITGCKNSIIPNDGSVVYIGTMAFDGCKDLKNIIIPNGVTRIGSAAFQGCSSLTDVIISNSVTNIDSSAFGNCSGLTNIIIPDSVITLGATSLNIGFSSNKATIIFMGLTPPTIPSNLITYTNYIEKIIVPAGCGDAYKSATNWSNYADYIEEATE